MPAPLLLALALQAAPPAAPPAAAPTAVSSAAGRSDFVCAVTDETGARQSLRYSVDLAANAWCAREPACEVKTVFGVKGAVVVLESSALEVSSYETSIDRTTGAYSAVVSLAAPPIRTESKGVCVAAPFTPFGVDVSGKALKP